MPNACCCYVIDAGYLFPTLMSAIQARAAIATSAADIIIFCVGHRSQEFDLFEPICREHGIEFVAVPSSAIDHMPIMFGRFYLSRLLDERYEAVVYIDGDTQISGSLQPLIDAHLEPNRFLAVRDPMSLMLDSQSWGWRARRDYFNKIGIGVSGLSRYCNSGVLRFNRGDWDAMSRAALRTSARHDHGLRYPRPGRAQPDVRERLLDDVLQMEFPELYVVLRLAGSDRSQDLPFHVQPTSLERSVQALGPDVVRSLCGSGERLSSATSLSEADRTFQGGQICGATAAKRPVRKPGLANASDPRANHACRGRSLRLIWHHPLSLIVRPRPSQS